MRLPWEDLEVFLAAADEGSLSAAARRLGLTQPTISRRIAAMEKRLGRQLFERGADGAVLTAEGARLHPTAVQMGRFAEQLNHLAQSADVETHGTVRVGVGSSHALEYLLPGAVELNKSFPQITVALTQHYHEAQLVEGTVDLALQGPLVSAPSVELLERTKLDQKAFAAPALTRQLERQFGTDPIRPQDINWIGGTSSLPWPGASAGFTSDDPATRMRAAEAGLGAILLPSIVGRDVHHSSLVPLNVGHGLREIELRLLGNQASLRLPHVRALAKQLSELLALG